MKVDEAVSWGCNAFTYLFSVVQTNEVLRLISFTLSILTSLVLIIYRLVKWWKEAKKDGKITKEESHEGIKIVVEGKDEIKKIVDNHKKGDKDGKD